MHLKYKMHRPNIYNIEYITGGSIFFIKFGWENIPPNASSYTVFLNDT